MAARLSDPVSGRVLDVSTNQPGIQFYDGKYLDGSASGNTGSTFGPRAGLCLEPQNFPDAPNHPNFPTSRLDPGVEEERPRPVCDGETGCCALSILETNANPHILAPGSLESATLLTDDGGKKSLLPLCPLRAAVGDLFGYLRFTGLAPPQDVWV